MNIKSLLVIVVLILGGAWYFNFFDNPEDTITKFGESVNNLDVEGILDTVDPAETKKFRAVTGLLGAVSYKVLGIDIVNTLLPMLPFAADYARANDDGSIPELHFEFIHTDMNLLRTEATVNAYLIDVTTNEKEEGIFHLKKIDRKWRIMNVEDVLN